MTLVTPPLYGDPGPLRCVVVNVLVVPDCSARLEDVSVRLQVQMWSCAVSLVEHGVHVFVELRVRLDLV